jgi:cold shock protein
MPTGTVTFYNMVGRFAIIRPDDGGAEIVGQVSAFTRAGLPPPKDGQRVSFDIDLNPNPYPHKGMPSAINIRPAE